MGHGKSLKMMFIKKNKTIFFLFFVFFFFLFCEENSRNIPKMKDDFQEMVKFRSWKTWRSHK